MICIEEWGQEPERASTPVEPAALDPVPTGSFAFRLGFGAPFARENGVRGVGRRLDVAVAQVAATDANLERNNRIYFTGSPALFLLSPPLLSLLSLPLFLFFFPPSPPLSFLSLSSWKVSTGGKEKEGQARHSGKNSLFRTCCVSTGMQPTEAGPHSALLTQLLLTWKWKYIPLRIIVKRGKRVYGLLLARSSRMYAIVRAFVLDLSRGSLSLFFLSFLSFFFFSFL